MFLVLVALFPPLLLWRWPRAWRLVPGLLLPLGLSLFLLWHGLGPWVALAALPALLAFFLGGELVYRSGVRFPWLRYSYRWAVLLTLPWGMGVFLLWLGLLKGDAPLALGGGGLALLGLYAIRGTLERGLAALERPEPLSEALRELEREEKLREGLEALLAGVDLEASFPLRLAWSPEGEVRLLSPGEVAPQGWREAFFTLEELLPGFDPSFPQGHWDWDGVLNALGHGKTPSWLSWEDPLGSLDRHDPGWRERLLAHPAWPGLRREALEGAREALAWGLFLRLSRGGDASAGGGAFLPPHTWGR
ncbi:hypothetical protein [Thermus tenuipuniceus]|uniref:hypothetical protein n=1 Tax=Thermus tenuipuniceus TaxID=2078690 RepID=UPI000CF86CBF|nr:hypothetical protein [Thermus tenuipuniceus]